MDFRQIVLVKESWYNLHGRYDGWEALFYDGLFQRDPMLRPRLSSTFQHQPHLFSLALDYIIIHLDRPQHFFYALNLLGRYFAQKGMQPTHYHMATQALLDALQQALGEQFTPAHHHAWEMACYSLSGLMKDAAALESTLPRRETHSSNYL